MSEENVAAVEDAYCVRVLTRFVVRERGHGSGLETEFDAAGLRARDARE